MNKIVIMKSCWNEHMTPYTIFRKVIESRVMQEPQFSLATCRKTFCASKYVLNSQNANLFEVILTKNNYQLRDQQIREIIITDFICVFLL